ncbi:hypothetical protein AB1Y20_019384 [Prymnesium parvum]|uniref:Calmodulin-lysine N-methyltransferase n=1 Tax=Prymnesium parvum TaxID=97485 RepID=A0AB34JRK3_PRYPA
MVETSDSSVDGECLVGVLHHSKIRQRVVEIDHPALPSVVRVEQRPDAPFTDEADGTCRRIWPTAVVLSRYFCANPDMLKGKRILELGAGAGIVGLVCAALGAELVVITDMPEALPLIEANVQRNSAVESQVAVMPCTWGDSEHENAILERAGGKFDLVIACEVVYKQDSSVLKALAETQRRLLLDSGFAMTAYEYRGELFDDIAYFDAVNALFNCEAMPLRHYEGDLAEDDEEESRYVYWYKPLRPEIMSS